MFIIGLWNGQARLVGPGRQVEADGWKVAFYTGEDTSFCDQPGSLVVLVLQEVKE